MLEVVYFSSGLILGGFVIFMFMRRQQRSVQQIAENLANEYKKQKDEEHGLLISQLKDSFGALSGEALSRNTTDFLKLASKAFSDQSRLSGQDMDNKKEIIDTTLKHIQSELNRVQDFVAKIENDRKLSFGALSSHLKNSMQQTQLLRESTNQLNQALSGAQSRGQWGERMAEDVLRTAGFVKGLNYLKQATVSGSLARPDFTFLLPQNRKINMDVKFPLDNYLSYVNASTENEREVAKKRFLKDVRLRIKEVTSRDYINPEDRTLDYVIVFIPNEQVYSFINEQDGTLLDEALKNKVILSSPTTLYAILAVVRQAIDNFNLQETATEILALLAEFYKQWAGFKDGMTKMGRRIEDAQKEFQALSTTRSRKLEAPIGKIDVLRQNAKHLAAGK